MVYFIETTSADSVIERVYTVCPDDAFALALEHADRYPSATVTTFVAHSIPLVIEPIGSFPPRVAA